MSTLSRIKTWISGDLLTANDLNGEFNNIINNYNGSINTSNIDLSISPTWTGFHTFSNSITFGATALKVSGIGAGVATITNANTATNRTLTLPDPGADSTLVALAGAQTITGAKTFSGADTLVIPVTAPNTVDGHIGTNSGVLTVGDGTAARAYTTLATPQTISGAKTFSGTANFDNNTLTIDGAGAGIATLVYANSASSRTITIPDPGASSELVTLAGTQTITGAKTFSTSTHIFSGADTLRIPTAAPATTSGNIGLSSGVLQIGDGTAARSYARLDNSQTFTGAKTFSGANTLIVPVTAPSAGTGSLAFINNELEVYNGTAVQHFPPVESGQQGLYNLSFAQGTDSSKLKITSATGSALGATNPGYVRIRSSTAGTYRTFTVTADVSIDLTGAHWGLDGKGNVTGAILIVYAIDDNGTLRWGVGYQGGFYYIRNTQDSTTATDINLPEEILTDTGVGTDNSPMRVVGWVKADFTDASNEWALTEYHPNESADGLWQPWTKTYTGFSADPTSIESFWAQVGRTIFLQEYIGTAGTSNATTYTVTAPVKSESGTSHISTFLSDNGSGLTSPGLVETASASTTITLYKTMTGGTWTGSSTKHARFNFAYRAYQP